MITLDIIKNDLKSLGFVKLLNDKGHVSEPCEEPCVEGYDCECAKTNCQHYTYLPDFISFAQRMREHKEKFITPFDREQSIFNYLDFITKKVTPNMFVVCDEEGSPIKRKKPEDFWSEERKNKKAIFEAYDAHVEEFEKAERKVLFKGFMYVTANDDIEGSIYFPNGDWFCYPYQIGERKNMENINDLINSHKGKHFLLK